MKKTGLYWLWLAVVIVIIDQVTKHIILTHFYLHEIYEVTSFFNLQLAHNTGAAFSFLSAYPNWPTILFSSIAVIVILYILIWLKRISFFHYTLCIALNCILGGALGNVWDRLQFGYVIDFIELHVNTVSFPIFNLADSAICLGTFLLLMNILLEKR